MQMLSQGAAPSPALWCPELLPESPSTASFWNCSSTAVECAAPRQRNQNRKQPLGALQPINGCFDSQFEPQLFFQSENRFSYKYRATEEDLNRPQHIFVPVDLDKTIHWDNRALKSLLATERHGVHRFRDFWKLLNKQNDFNYTLYRSETVKWILDVCTEENCDFGVFPLAVSYLNRVLFIQTIPPSSLQALASACLFLASKMKAPQPITAKRLSQYSEGYVPADTILDWEMVIVNLLEWEISLHTIFEFFDQLMARAPALEDLREAFCSAAFSIQLDENLCCLLPSVQCALVVCSLTMNTPESSEYQKLVKDNLNVDLRKLEHYLYLNPKLGENDIGFPQQTDACQRRPTLYQSTNPFVALV